jgi:hypothetical protein
MDMDDAGAQCMHGHQLRMGGKADAVEADAEAQQQSIFAYAGRTCNPNEGITSDQHVHNHLE